MLKYYVEYNEFGKFDKKAAIYALYSFTIEKAWDYSEEEDGHIVIKDIDENNAIAKVYYRDDSVDEVKITKDMDKGGVWIPLEYREIQPAQLEEKTVILSYHDGSYYYDEAEWVNDFDEERIKELEELGVNDMNFENGYYVYNEKEEQIPLAFVYKILKQLSKAGIVGLERGPKGGCCLLVNLNEVSLYDLIIAMEENVHVTGCMRSDYDCE